jgi:Rrf2 family nitric oxide-sensitive transcriptional repressor
LRALVYLGAHADRLCTIAEIARSYNISDNHLMKVVNRLAARGYVETTRGKGGGLRLARAPHLVNIGAVVRDMEERFDLVECFDEARQGCPLLPGCRLKSILGTAQRNFLSTLDRHTLQEILDGGASAVFNRTGRKRIPIHRVP